MPGDFTDPGLFLSAGNSVQGIIGRGFLILSTLYPNWEYFALVHAKIFGLSQDNDKRPSSASCVVVVSDHARKKFNHLINRHSTVDKTFNFCHPHVQK